MCVALLKHHGGHGEGKPGLFDRMLKVYGKAVGWFVRLRWLTVPIYLGACGLVLWVLGLQVGTELFPQIDSGEFVLRFRPPPGSNFELTRQMAIKCLEEIEREAKPEHIAITMGYVGQVAPNFGIDNMVLFMRGPDDGQLRVALTEDSGIKLDEFRERLRKVLPERVIPWLTKRLEQGGLSPSEAQRQAKMSTFGFEPGDIVTEVMSFGASTPIAIRIVGTDLKMVRQHAEKIAANMKRIPFLRDIHFEQQLDYPTVEVNIDREKAGLSGAKVEDVAHAIVMATASTRFASLNYWIDVKTGFDYLVQLQVPPLRIEKPEDVETLPVDSVNPLVNLMIRDVAMVRRGVRPGEIDRDMSQRYVTLVANVEHEDMGRASRQVAEALASAGEPPRGVRVETMGQLPPMNEMFESLSIGLAVAVFVIFVLLTAYFQSPRLALISIGAVPGVLAGIAIILYLTNTSLNIESFMGSIMCLGVSVSNSVMLVTFIDEHWKRGTHSSEAAIMGASERLRPILMTACAMTVGMVPMALALERGSQMQAPLGRAVIGGLVMSSFATLLVRSLDLRARDRQEGGPVAVDLPGRPRERALRPERLRRRGACRPASLARRRRQPLSSRRPGVGFHTRGAPECHPLTRRTLMRRELGKVARAAARMHRPLTWRSPLRRDLWPMVPYRSAYRCWLLFGLLSALAMPGCSHKGEVSFTSATKPTTVQVINPTVRNIVRVVGQPSFIESYERTSIYPKPTAYIQKWIVDIGDKVKKGDVLAILFAPELIEEDGTKQANVVLDQQRIALAKEVVEVAKADVAAAVARVKEAEEILDKYQAEVERWDTEVKRLQREAERGVVDPRVLLESTNQLKSSTAARDKAAATIKRTKAELLSAQATLAKAEVDVRVAEADLKVAESEQRYAKAWVDYLTLTAPFDGVITGRNANTYDFVLPTTGDPTAFYLAPDISPGGAAPIYVVDRTDIVRIFVDIPEQDANYVHVGSKATVLAKAYRDQPIPGTVTRISWR